MRIRKFAKILAAALTCAFVFIATAYAATAPPDVAGKPYEPAVSALADLNVIVGDVDGLFYPDANLTRAQFCTIVVKAMRAPVATVNGTPSQDTKKSGFPDLSGYGWAEGYISYAVDKGVVTGYPDGSFKPGNNVTMNELITMTLRAAGYDDASLGGVWPENYVAKAGDIGALAGLIAPLPEHATKWMAAQLVYNVLSRIEAANPPEDTPAGNENPAESPAGAALVFINAGAFDSDITTFAGKALASGVKVLRCGLKADYSQNMTLSEDKDAYLEDTVYKYKNVTTPAWYELTGDKVTRIVLPRDVGFSGRAYGVITGVARATDNQGDATDAFVTLTAGRVITWIGSSGLASGNVPSKEEYGNGQLFEFQLRNGEVTNVASVGGDPPFGVLKSAAAVEIGSSTTFAAIKSKVGNVVTIDPKGDGVTTVVEIRDRASVYLLDADGTYSIGALSDVREKTAVRLYDVSDDKTESADAVIVKQQ
ncbi:MAG: S-layer homology domain-containing protein [Clostridiales Family XIII bacterium]|jgi:hypothetical protein|nr:S-layer homology domain-containing protein [Clostridiales Family XIII bacterium]